MIRFFRSIKSNLVQDGKAGKYLAYALGEIVLVVIGIILAVQINNWIENEKRQNLQVEILREIQKNLEGDLREVNDELENYTLMQEYDSSLLTSAQQNLPFNDPLGGYAYSLEISGHMNPTLSGYEMLKSKGIDLITDDSLRITLTDLYERWYTYYMKYENERIAIVQTLIKPYMTKNFYQEKDTAFWTGRKRVPMNYTALTKDPEWVSIIQTNEGLAIVMTTKARFLKRLIQEMLDRLEAYLKEQDN